MSSAKTIADERGVRAGEIERPEYRSARRLYLIEEASDQEEAPDDVRITEEDRRLVRRLVAVLEPAMSAELLMFVSCAIEAASQRQRALEKSA
jgi:hypothetical protein